MASPEELFFDRPWGRLAAKAWGPPDGRRWLALHGWLDNAATFDGLGPLLPAGVRLVALDLPGHGHSAHFPAGMPYFYLGAVPEIIAVLDALHWPTAGLIGHSLGGTLATVIAGALPERVDALVLLESSGPLSSPANQAPALLADFIKKNDQLAGKELPVYRSLEEAAAVRAAAAPLTVTLSSAMTLIKRQMSPTEGGYTWRSDPRLRLPSPSRFTEPQVEAFLSAIRCPTLVVRAQPGITIAAEVWQRRAALVPKLRIEYVKGNHHVHLDDPAVVAPIVGPFLLSPR